MNTTVLLVDGMAYVYRAFYAIPPMASPEGVPTNATFGFARMLQRMVNEAAPDYLAVAFDSREPTFRHAQFEQYKAQRPPMPDELAVQLPWIKEYVAALNIPCLEYPGFEADDIIGTVATRAARAQAHTLIATCDKDLCQLVSPHIAILAMNLQESEVLDESGVLAKFGVRPDQIVDYLALVGDTSDNVPGVPGIGPKTAQALLSQFGSLDAVLAGSAGLKPGVRAKLEEARPRIGLVRTLLAVHCDVPVREELDDLRVREPQVDRLAQVRVKLGFRSPADAQPAKPARLAEPQPELF